MTGRQSDASKAATFERLKRWKKALCAITKRKGSLRESAFSSTAVLCAVASQFDAAHTDLGNQLACSNRISLTSFTYNFNMFSDSDCLSHFHFEQKDVGRLVGALAWPEDKQLTSRNRYSVSPILSTCVILRRLASPARWRDLEELFGKHASQLSEIFWEGIENLMEKRGRLLTDPIAAGYMQSRLEIFSSAVHEKSRCMDNCVGFIDGTVIGIARPSGNDLQMSAYNGHKRKHALKYQAVNTPDGIIAHVYGPLEGRRHDWTLYVRSGLEEHLPTVLEKNGKRYCISGDSGYSLRWFMEVPFRGSNLTAAQSAFNKAMSSVRITVEWIFKEVKLYFTTMDYKRKMKVLEAPVGTLYMAAMLLCNMRNCIYHNQISRYFGCPLPTLEEYLEHRE